MYHGVPVVGVPLFGDHYDTMTRVAAKGMGIMLHWKYMSEEDLHTALTSIITDSRSDFYIFYQQSTQLNVIVYQRHLVAALWCTSPCPLAYYKDCDFCTALVPTPLSPYQGIASKHNFCPAFTKTSQATLWPELSTGSATSSVTMVPTTCALPCMRCPPTSISCWTWFFLSGLWWLWQSLHYGTWYDCWRGRSWTRVQELESMVTWLTAIATVRAWSTGNTNAMAPWKPRRRWINVLNGQEGWGGSCPDDSDLGLVQKLC